MTVHVAAKKFRFSNKNLADQAISMYNAFRRGFSPPPDMTVSEWADQRRILDSESSRESGRWSTDRTPYMRTIMEQISAKCPTIRTVIMKGAQVGGSETGLNLIGFVIDVAPVPIILVTPTGSLAERYSKTRLNPMIALCKTLRDKIGGTRNGDTLTMKRFPGGVLAIVSSHAAAELRSMPAAIMIFEEPDAYPEDAQEEGSVIDLVYARSNTYGFRKKIFLNCTPTLEQTSVTFKEYQLGDRSHYEMPCPHCGCFTVWHKEFFRHDRGNPDTAHFACRHCGEAIFEGLHKTSMLSQGVWTPTNPTPAKLTRSFYLPSSLSPIGWLSWSEIAQREDEARDNYTKSKTLLNTVWGLPWRDSASAPDIESLVARAKAEGYAQREVPPWVTFICAGVDIGTDHIEIGVWGFGRSQRRHHIEQIRINGRHNHPDMWLKLENVLTRRYLHPKGAILPIRRVFVDRGWASDYVDPWVNSQNPEFISACKGLPLPAGDYVARHQKKWARDGQGKKMFGQVAVRFYFVGVDMLKMELYNRLNLPWPAGQSEPPAGWISFSKNTHRDWYDQLVGEDYVLKQSKGRTKGVWVPKNQSQRVEALDCCNYARAAANQEGWDDWMPADFDREDKKIEDEARKLRDAMDLESRARLEKGDKTPVDFRDFADRKRTLVLPTDDYATTTMGTTLVEEYDLMEETDDAASRSVQAQEKKPEADIGEGKGFATSWLNKKAPKTEETDVGVVKKRSPWKFSIPDMGSSEE